MLEDAKSLQDELLELRRRFHALPELSFEEFASSQFIRDYLLNLGYDIKHGFGDTAVIADMGPAPFVALRSDMDALAIQELNVSSYVSQKAGVMHACGHDAHMACLLVVAKILSQNAKKMQKGIRLIFEPGSESNERSSAQELIKLGVLQNVDCIFGFHVDSTLKAMDVAVVKDPGLYRSLLTLESREQRVVEDSIYAFAQLIVALKESLSGPLGVSSMPLLEFKAMQTNGCEISLEFQINAQSPEHLENSRVAVRKVVSASALSNFLNLKVLDGNSEVNGRAISALSLAMDELCPAEKQKLTTRRAWSKDFEVYSSKVSAAFFYLGTSCGPRSHHSASFELDERALHLGVAILSKAALNAASNKS